MTPAAKKVPILRKQMPNRKVLLASLPCIAGSVYFFGWRSLGVVLAACLAGFLAEFFFCRRRKEPVSEAVFVSGVLYALTLPPTVPWHVVVIGIVFGIVFGKELFGGFARNIFNPALTARCFVYICFPVALTSQWAPVAQGRWGALDRWTTAATPDVITSATPAALLKAGGVTSLTAALSKAFPDVTVADFFFGRLPGSMGVTSTMLILIGGLYLFFTRTANRTIILTVVLVYAGLHELLHQLGVGGFYGGVPAVMAGGFLFGACFMATDPVSSAKTATGRVIYGAIIAVCTLVIRSYSVFNGGMMFAILLGNTFAPIIDYAVKAGQTARKAQKGAKGPGGQEDGAAPTEQKGAATGSATPPAGQAEGGAC